ncbi:putative peptidylprolyl isomerase [Rosa chinensis]|uniref:peptidylprolyl isomerase n=1 Tax=Rosa chinensis TaxID=74649 RepID=A0A2P6S5A7_ROSCH|nr:putative peptidylprolyl isomerase [Rosa chinensis]
MDELQQIVEDKNRDELLRNRKNYYSMLEVEYMGRATVDMKVKVKDNPNLTDYVFRIVLDGYNAPVTSGNFVDLVERHFYDGIEIQRGKFHSTNLYDISLSVFS